MVIVANIRTVLSTVDVCRSSCVAQQRLTRASYKTRLVGTVQPAVNSSTVRTGASDPASLTTRGHLAPALIVRTSVLQIAITIPKEPKNTGIQMSETL